ncbi:MAG TPA: 30S ribosomal protein S16 [Candidatus Paceibacterota bacterium]
MLMIRLQRLGRKHDPSYRIVVTDKAVGPKAGKYVEELGHYDARRIRGSDVVIKADRAKYWLSVGACASGTVHNILVREGIVVGKKKDVRPAKIVKKAEIEPVPIKKEPL